MAILSSPNVQLYTLGRGILYIGEWDSTTPPQSWVDLGNCPKMDVEVTEEVLEHYSYRSGLKTKDKVIVLESGYTCSFDLDEISLANLKIFLKGTLAAGGHIIRANTALSKEYALLFRSNNPNEDGENQKWEFWRAKLTPAGAFSLIADDWMKLSFKAEGLSDITNHPESPYFDVMIGTTTTSG